MLNFKNFIKEALSGNGVQNDSLDVWVDIGEEQYAISVLDVLGREEQEPYESSYALEGDLEHPAWELLYTQYVEDVPALNYEVYEDNGGGISMFVLDGGNPIWGRSGYEFLPENLSQDIGALADADPEDVPNWDGNGVFSGQAFVAWEDTPAGGLRAAYLEISQAAELVADGSGVYPDRMGAAGREAFGI